MRFAERDHGFGELFHVRFHCSLVAGLQGNKGTIKAKHAEVSEMVGDS